MSGRRWRAATGAGLAVALAAAAPALASWRVRCDVGTGEVAAVEGPVAAGEVALADDFPGPSTARAWIEENCASARCDAAGRCVEAAAAPVAPDRPAGETAAGGWEAGELVDLAGGRAAARPAAAAPARALPPVAADLSPLVSTAHAAADACRYDAALATAEQMAEFDPVHPFLAANGEKLRGLAARQKRAESAVWRAAQLLEQQDFKRARAVAREAAQAAVGCQTTAVSQLVRGIEEADARLRAERNIANRRAAAALLVPLISLANALQSEGKVGVPAGAAPVFSAGAAAAAGGAAPLDRCVFDYAYPNKWTFEPVCSCPGWSFDPRQFRCAPAGAPRR